MTSWMMILSAILLLFLVDGTPDKTLDLKPATSDDAKGPSSQAGLSDDAKAMLADYPELDQHTVSMCDQNWQDLQKHSPPDSFRERKVPVGKVFAVYLSRKARGKKPGTKSHEFSIEELKQEAVDADRNSDGFITFEESVLDYVAQVDKWKKLRASEASPTTVAPILLENNTAVKPNFLAIEDEPNFLESTTCQCTNVMKLHEGYDQREKKRISLHGRNLCTLHRMASVLQFDKFCERRLVCRLRDHVSMRPLRTKTRIHMHRCHSRVNDCWVLPFKPSLQCPAKHSI
jgi:hypothetical protein